MVCLVFNNPREEGTHSSLALKVPFSSKGHIPAFLYIKVPVKTPRSDLPKQGSKNSQHQFRRINRARAAPRSNVGAGPRMAQAWTTFHLKNSHLVTSEINLKLLLCPAALWAPAPGDEKGTTWPMQCSLGSNEDEFGTRGRPAPHAAGTVTVCYPALVIVWTPGEQTSRLLFPPLCPWTIAEQRKPFESKVCVLYFFFLVFHVTKQNSIFTSCFTKYYKLYICIFY